MNPSKDSLPSTIVQDSFAERLKKTYGEGVDPGVSLNEGPNPASTAPMSELLTRLGTHGLKTSRYRLQGEIARGGMGAIFKLWDENLRRHLAMKVILGRDESPVQGGTPKFDARTVGRFLEEAQVTGQLDHPGVVPVHEVGLDADGRVYFTMRLVKGRDLMEIIDLVFRGKEGWNQTRALGVILKVCEAMAYAHQKGVIHRDLKPANVMVGNFGEVYVMDWGIARVAGRKDTHDIRIRPEPKPPTMSVQTERREEKERSPDSPLVTMDGDVMGTPCYMAPEQARGDIEKLGPRSDVYSVGAMLYHLLTGHMPYVPPGARVTNRTVLALVQQGPPKPVHELNHDVPAELVAICEKAMARDPDRRYPDTLAMADDLRAYLENRVVKAYRTGAFAEFNKWVARNRGLAASIAAMLALILGGLGGLSLVQARANQQIGKERDRANAKATEAEANARTAADNARTAADNERTAQEQRDQVLRLADVKRLSDYVAEADELWPACPENIDRTEKWLDKAWQLARRIDVHRQTLDTLREKALPYDDETRKKDRETHPRAAELEQARQRFEFDNVAKLETIVSKRRTWKFEDTEEQWQHDTLDGLVHGLDDFQSDDPKVGVIKSVEGRLEFARSVRKRTIDDVRAKWAEAIASIANELECPKYRGARITAQLGLIPIGRDTNSGLWEFAHVQTGAVPERSADGKLEITEETGLVLVLIPGGTFEMGSPESEPGRNADEGPTQEVALAPFFLSKYEMTQAQWQRFTGTNPSQAIPPGDLGGKKKTLLYPVEQVSWEEGDRVLRRLGLVLPTEAQWEYAARAGTKTPWWTGDDPSALREAANLADSYAKTHGGPSSWVVESWDDGYLGPAPVGSYRANPFGLHDMHGNVWEWCRDLFGSYQSPTRPGDGERRASSSATRVFRGGGFTFTAAVARSAARDSSAPGYRGYDLGVRPARSVTTD
jgi:formylglycine-generating enzyme required for sulfatase activity/serine/threonine protein kinase